jgi:hypothetical protein
MMKMFLTDSAVPTWTRFRTGAACSLLAIPA